MLLREKMVRFEEAGLYLVTSELHSSGRKTETIVHAALSAGVRLFQLREKTWPLRELIERAEPIRAWTRQAGALLIVNDRIDVALAIDADGVHLGRRDLPVSAARRIAPHLVVGASAHSVEDAKGAERDGASYVNIGPVFATRTKAWSGAFVGLDEVRRVADAVSIPFTVMGGIKRRHVPELVRSGARTIALITGVTAAPDPERAARDLLSDIGRARADAVRERR